MIVFISESICWLADVIHAVQFQLLIVVVSNKFQCSTG